MQYRVEVLAAGESTWSGNALTFATEEDAEAYAVDLAARWTLVVKYRIVPTATPRRQPYEP